MNYFLKNCRKRYYLLRVIIIFLMIFFILNLCDGLLDLIFASDSGVIFTGFNFNTISMDISDWARIDTEINGTVFDMVGEESIAASYININSISNSVDLGGLEIDFSVDACISDETSEELDNAYAIIHFRKIETGEDISSVLLTRGTENPGTYISLTSNASIPIDTRFIIVDLYGTMAGSTNTVKFDNLSLYIKDTLDPTISESYNQDWTSEDVQITITAQDSDSGVEGIYDALNSTKITSESTYDFSVSSNSSYSFYSMDYAGRISPTLDVEITNIDKKDPLLPPTINVGAEDWSNSDVMFFLSEITPAEDESPEKRQYSLNGGSWDDYTGEVWISTEGNTLIKSRTIDAALNTSVEESKNVYVDKTPPLIISITSIPNESGGAEITTLIDDGDGSGIAVKKWAYGTQNIEYFADNGNIFTGDSFEVSKGGEVTIYAKDAVEYESIDTINVNTYPNIDNISSQSVNEDENKELTFNIWDNETESTNLLVSASSSNTELLADPECTNNEGSVTLTLDPIQNKFGGPITITVTVTDGDGLVSSKQFDVTINSINDIPIAQNDTGIIASEDSSKIIYVLENDSDVEGNDYTVNDVGEAANGTVAIAGDGKSVTYEPNANFNGEDSFTYNVTDGSDVSNYATCYINVTEVNDVPVAVNDNLTIIEDQQPLIDVLQNDTDNDIDTTIDEKLTIISVENPLNGNTSVENNNIRYTPLENWSGTDSFGYTIQDKDGITSNAVVNISVEPYDDSPEFTNLNSSYTILEDSTNNEILFNITDIETDNESLMLQIHSSNESIVSDSNITIQGLGDTESQVGLSITPISQAFGSTTVTLLISDGFQVTKETFTLNVTNVNDNPVAVGDEYQYTEDDNSLIIDMDDLILNDTDIDGDELEFNGIIGEPSAGTLTKEDAEENTWRFTPPPNYNQNVTFTYSVSDGTDTDSGVVLIKVNSINDTPIITLDAENIFNTDEDTIFNGINFTIDDVDADIGDLIVVAGSSDVDLISAGNIDITKGLDGRCSLTIQPNPDQYGTDTITIMVSDGEKIASVNFEFIVNFVEDLPIANNDNVVVAESGQVVIRPLENDIDADNDTLTLLSFEQPEHGTVVLSGENELTYTPVLGCTGLFPFSYTICDGDDTVTANINLNVLSLADPPIITHIENKYINEDDNTGDVPFQVTDKDIGDVISVTAISSNEVLIPNSLENIVLTNVSGEEYTIKAIPLANQYGTAIITITVEDLAGNTDISTFKVTVYPVNDIPTAAADIVDVDEDSEVSINVLANDSDLETTHENLKIVSMTNPQHGWLSNYSGEFKYTPYNDYNGSDVFTYTITDGETEVNANVNINVNAVNDTPDAWDNWYEMNNVVNESRIMNILGNDHDDDGDTIYIDSITSDPQYGTAVINEDGTVTYTRTQVSPENNGADSFQYSIRDRENTGGDILYDIATVYIGVEFNAQVSARNVSITRNEDNSPNAESSFWIDLDFSNPNGNSIEISCEDPVLGDIIEIDVENKRVLFKPEENANGSESFTYTVTDNIVDPSQSDSGTIYVKLLPVNDAPHFIKIPGSQAIDEDTVAGLEETTGEILVSFDDVDLEHNASDLIFEVYVTNDDPQNIVILDENITVTRSDDTVKILMSPLENAFGTATITFLLSDGLISTTESFELVVNPINDAPVAEDLAIELYEDTSKDIIVVNSNTDVDGDELSLTIDEINTPQHGIVVINPDKTITYTPDNDYFGPDSFQYIIDDGNGETDTGTITITVDNINDAPLLTNLSKYNVINEDEEAFVSFNASDVDGDNLSIYWTSSNQELLPNGSISLSDLEVEKLLTLTPVANSFGLSVITLTVDDGTTTVSQNFQLTVQSENDIPVANDDTYIIDEDNQKVFSILDNDTDVEDTTLKIVEISPTAKGGIVINNLNGTVTYIPSENYYGTDTFTYTVADDNNGVSSATVTVNINSINDHPNADNDQINTLEDQSVIIDLLQNDSDVENDNLEILSIGSGSKALSIVDNLDGTVTYTPNTDENGLDTFTYTITDGQLENNTDTATVTVNIIPINDAPTIEKNTSNPGDWEFNEDETGVFKFDINDAETQAENLIVTIKSSDQSLVSDTSITFSGTGIVKTVNINPARNKSGSFLLRVEGSDGVNTTVREFDITINPVNDRPNIEVDDATTNEDTPVSGVATGSDVETDLSSLIFSLGTGSDDGSVEVDVDGSWTYTPNEHFSGSDSFEIVVDDGGGFDNSTNTETVNITVNSVNDPPIANNDSGTTNEDESITINVLANDTDPDISREGDSLTVVSTSDVNNGSAVINPDNTITFNPAENYNGTLDFTYTIRDEAGIQRSATVTVVVNAVDDMPSSGDDSYTVKEDTPKILYVLSNDDIDEVTNPDIEDLTIISTTNPNNGVINIAKDNKSITYTPNENYNGVDAFKYTMKDIDGDQHGHEVEFSVNITVSPVNDTPTITIIDHQNIAEDNQSDAIAFSVTDVEDNDVGLEVNASSSNLTLLSNESLNSNIANTGGTGRTITLIPNENQNGIAEVILTVRDAGGLEQSTTFNVTVTPVNDDPNAANDTAVTDENTTIIVDVLSNDDVDLDIEGDALDIISVVDKDEVSYGTFEIYVDTGDNSKEKIRYIPNVDWDSTVEKVEVLQYTMTDAIGGIQSTAELAITITPVNDNPLISSIDDPPAFDEDYVDGTGEISFTVSDEEDEDDTLEVTAISSDTSLIPNENIFITNPEGGSANDRTVKVVSAENQNGQAIITLTVTDNEGLIATETFTVEISPVNDGPANGDDTFTVVEDTPTELIVLENDDLDEGTNPDIEGLTVVGIETQPTYGTVDFATYGGTKILYTPYENNNLQDIFQYRMRDSEGIEAVFTVIINMQPVNDTPDIISSIGDQTVNEGTGTGDLSFTVTDVDDDDVTLIVTAESNQQILIPNDNILITNEGGSDRTVKINPQGRWNGVATITLTVKDDEDASDAGSIATFIVVVQPINDPPIANDDLNYITNEDNAIVLNVLNNDTDADLETNPETETMTIVSIDSIENGTLEIINEGSALRFTPQDNWNGIKEFSYTIQDTEGVEDTALVRVKVSGKNDSPFALNDTAETDEDTPVLVNVLSNDSDVDTNVTLNNDSFANPADEGISIKADGFSNVDNGTVEIVDGKVKFTPTDNWNGTEVFTYTTIDASGATDVADVTVSVNGRNDMPVAVDDIAETDEDTPVLINVLSNDSDIDLSESLNNDLSADPTNEQISIKVDGFTGVDNGTVEIVDGKVRFTPAENWNGTEVFTYTIIDATSVTQSAQVEIVVLPINDVPTITAIVEQNILEDESTPALSFTVTDVEDSDASLTVETSSSNLILVPNDGGHIAGVDEAQATRSVTITPSENENGTVDITLTVRDSQGATSTSTFTVNVGAINDEPTAIDDYKATNEDTEISFNILTNDTDPDTNREGDTKSVTGNTNTEHGDLIVGSDGSVTYSPDDNWNGTDTFTYTMKDKDNISSSATVTITVNGINDSPVALNDTAETDEDTPVFIDVLSNDSDVDTDVTLNNDSFANPADEEITIKADGFNGVDNGTVEVVDGKVRFTPAENWNGTETFTYTTIDASSAIDVANVTVIVNGINDKPVAADDTIETDEETPVIIDVLLNDSDVDLDEDLNNDPFANPVFEKLLIKSDGFTGVDNGIVEVVGGKVRFTPTENWNGTEIFTYTTIDNFGATDIANVIVKVNGTNDAPIAVDDTTETDEDTPVLINVLSNDSDVDTNVTLNNDPLANPADEEITIKADGFTGVDNGTVEVVDGKIRFTPAENWNGTETLAYTTIDDSGAVATANVTVIVNSTNDTPVASDDTIETDEDTAVLIDGLLNDSDVDMDVSLNKDPSANPADNEITIKADGFTGVDNGIVEVVEGKVRFTPAENWNGTEVFTYTTIDNSGATDTASVTVTVNGENDAPIAVDDIIETDEDTAVIIDVLINDHDIDTNNSLNNAENADPTSEVIIIKDNGFSGVDKGIVEIVGGAVRFTPNENWNGTETFTYTIEDTSGATDTATVTVMINATNDLPVANDDAAITDEDTAILIDVLSNDSDIDMDVSLNNDLSSNPIDKQIFIKTDGFSSVDNGVVEIDENKIKFIPAENWTGTEIFSYTVIDSDGDTDTAEVTVVVTSVNDAPLVTVMLTPYEGEKYKVGNTINVSWITSQDIEKDTIKYKLEFYDGNSWILLTEELTELNYQHTITDDTLHTDEVKYRVYAYDGELYSEPAVGKEIIIDSRAPEEVIVNIESSEGNNVESAVWVNKTVNVAMTGGEDLLPIYYSYSIDGKNPVSVLSGEKIVFEGDGIYTIGLFAKDELDNNTKIGDYEIKIDTQQPLVPDITFEPIDMTNKPVSINLTLKNDPGESGNKTLTFPDEKKSVIENEMSFEVYENGKYTYTLEDNAGNITEFDVDVDLIDKVNPVIQFNSNGTNTNTWSNSALIGKLSYSDDYSGIDSKKYAVSSSKYNGGKWLIWDQSINIYKDGEYYIHALATDKAGNSTTTVFGPYMIDVTPPVLNAVITQEHDESIIKIEAYDTSSGLYSLKLSDGTELKLERDQKINFEGKSVTITAIDKAGNITEFELENTIAIDKETDGLTPPDDFYDIEYDKASELATLTINLENLESGAKKIRFNGGEWMDSDKIILENIPYGVYEIEVMDTYENIKKYTIEVTKIDIEKTSWINENSFGTLMIGLLGLILLIIMLINMKVTVTMEIDEEHIRSKKFRWFVISRKNHSIEKKIRIEKDFRVDTIELWMSRGLTRRVRGNTVTIIPNDEKSYEIKIPEDKKGSYKETFKLK